jgi:pilus assembly protein CpaC
MAKSTKSVWKGICRALVPAVLGGVIQAQTAVLGSGASAAVAGSTNMATLSQASTPLANRSEYAGTALHILLGRSVLVETARRLKRVYVSNPLIIDSFTSSPTQIVVTAKAPGISSLILWDEAGQSQTYLVSSDTDVANLQQEIHRAMPNEDIRVESEQDRISLSGTAVDDASSQAAFKLASLYTKTVVNSVVVRQTHLRQVKLKVQIVEVDRSKIDELGINIFSQGKNTGAVQTGQFPSVGTTTTTSSTGAATPPTLSVSNPLNLLLYNSGLNIGLTLQDLQNKQVLQILAEPTITTLSGQKASFLSGGEFPFPVVQGSSGGTTSITIQFRSYGVKLEFTPIVNDDGTIQLKVMPEVSALDFTNAVTISGYTIPAIATRRADTQVELRDGQSFAISGLLDHRTTDILSKMPGIGDVPVLGQLFRSKNISHSTVELVVIVTPTVVDPLTDTTTPSQPKLPVPLLDPAQFDKSTGKQKPVTRPQAGTGGNQ